jgi:hypothetical protein
VSVRWNPRYSAFDPATGRVHYADRKRWLRALSVLYPLTPFTGIALHAATGQPLWLLLPLALGFQLERHSDHHANAARRYQSLRHFPDLPQLPSGYFGMFPLAYVPALWFKVMDARLLALPLVRGDFARINVAPSRRVALMARHGCATSAES